MVEEHILVYSEDATVFPKIAQALPENCTARYLQEVPALRRALEEGEVSCCLLILAQDFTREEIICLAPRYQLPLVAMVDEMLTVEQTRELVQLQPLAILERSLDREALREALSKVLTQRGARPQRRSMEHDLREANQRLNQRLQELNIIYTIGKSVTASLDVDEVLERAVAAAVNLTRAEEGLVVLREGDQLYVRVSKRQGAPPERRYLETTDSVAWQVIRSGRPAMLDRETRIATGFLVNSLLYVPIQVPERGTIGILGVVNHESPAAFTESQLFALSSIADFSAIALENAHLFSTMEAEHSRLSTILEDAAEAIIVTDTENRLLLWSEAAAQAFAIPAEAHGAPLQEHIANETLRELFEHAAGEEPVQHAEIELEAGPVFNAQLSSIEGVGRVAVMQDITHLKELDHLKSEFVSTVSHDLRTPLTTIQGYVELLDRVGPLTEMQQSFIDKALNSLSHITALITDLLDIGRIEAGYDLEMAPLRLEEVIQQVAEEVSIDAEDAEVSLYTELPETPLWVQGNARRLRQVLENLVGNAIKYNRPGGWVRIREQRDDDHVIVSVEDNGIGISTEEQPRIFERFYRVQSPETQEIHGTGLGLAIVKSVIEKHKGRVWVESTPGEGSTFAFVLSTQEVDGS